MENKKLSNQLFDDANELVDDLYRKYAVLDAALEKEAHQKEVLDGLEAYHMSQITNEKDQTTGKPLFSNAESRQAELTRRTSIDPDMVVARTNYDSAVSDRKWVQRDIEALNMRFSLHKALLNSGNF